MSPLVPYRRSSWYRGCFLAALCAAAVHSTFARADDPVEKVREALKLDTPRLSPEQLEVQRNKLFDAAVAELKSLSQLRRAYYLVEWSEKYEPGKKANVVIDRHRNQIAANFAKAVRSAAKQPNPDVQVAVAILIAEIADREPPIQRELKEKFTRGWSDVVYELVKAKDLATRQAALSALGKITPDLTQAIPVLKATMQKDELGPRRLAAYALTDLARNARSNVPYLNRKERLDTMERVTDTAAFGLRAQTPELDAEPDEPVRAYCLEAVQEAAKAFSDFLSASEEPLTVEPVKGMKETLRPDLRQVLKSFQDANAPILRALHDPQISVRLTALRTLDQIGDMRVRIIQTLQALRADAADNRSETLKAFDAPDPLASIIDKDWKQIARLLKEDDVRLRLGALEFFDLLGVQAEPAMVEIADALRDPDRLVKQYAVRTIRNLPAQKVSAGAVRSLANLLLDADPDLSAAAAEALGTLGSVAQDAVDSLAFVIGNGDAGNRNWDADNRIKAMKALVAINGAPSHKAIPQLISALTDPDVRLRRQAAESLGRLGRPADPELAQRATTALRNALRDEDSDVRLNASEAIPSIAPR